VSEEKEGQKVMMDHEVFKGHKVFKGHEGRREEMVILVKY
jgi:hypothetical protein